MSDVDVHDGNLSSNSSDIFSPSSSEVTGVSLTSSDMTDDSYISLSEDDSHHSTELSHASDEEVSCGSLKITYFCIMVYVQCM